MKTQNQFIETALVHDSQKYGLLREPIEAAIVAGKVVVREVDIQGLQSVHENLAREKFAAIFVAPPSFEILEKRIRKRQPGMSADELARRLDSAEKEIEQKNLADFEVISGENEIEKMVADLEKIIADATKN